MAIDLGLLEDDLSQYDEDYGFISDYFGKTIGKHCAGKRTLPMTTTKFDEVMDEKAENLKDGASIPKIEFTVEADRDLIKGLYRTTFDAVIGRAVNIDWQGLGWEYELHELMPVLMSAAGTLQQLDLSPNNFRGPCVEAVRKLTSMRRHPGVHQQPHQLEDSQPACPGQWQRRLEECVRVCAVYMETHEPTHRRLPTSIGNL